MSKLSDLFIPGLISLSLLALVGTELRSHPTEDKTRTHISVWVGWSGFEYDAFQSVVNDYNRSQTKVFVDVLSISGNSTKTLISTSAGIPGAAHLSRLTATNVLQDDDRAGAMERTESDLEPASWLTVRLAPHSIALLTLTLESKTP